MSKTEGKISGWHNLSTNGDVNVNGITSQDILSILKSITSNNSFITWSVAIDQIFDHIANLQNPHNLTMDQVKTSVIRIVYETWLTYGYSGTISYFVELLFRYIEYADDTIMSEGVSEEHVPPVYMLTKSVKTHNEDINAHENLFNSYFVGDSDVGIPSFIMSQLVGSFPLLDTYKNVAGNYFENVPINILGYDFLDTNKLTATPYLGDFTVALSFRLFKMPMLQIYSSVSNTIYRLFSKPNDTNSIQLTRCTSNSNSNISIGITTDFSYLSNVSLSTLTVPVEGNIVKCFVMFKNDQLTLAIKDAQQITTIPLGQYIISGFENDLPHTFSLLNKFRHPKDMRLSFPTVNSGDPLVDLILYPKVFTVDQLIYMDNVLNKNIATDSVYQIPVIVPRQVLPS